MSLTQRIRSSAAATVGACWACACIGLLQACTGGGSTGDFTGDWVDCENTRDVPLSEESPLGYTPESVLAFSEGDIVTPLRWLAPCASPGEPCGKKGCADAPIPAMNGSETTLRMSVWRTGEPAQVAYPDDAGLPCAEQMWIPVEFRFSTDDGSFDERVEAVLWTDNGLMASVSSVGLLQELHGSMVDDEAFGERTGYELQLFFEPESASGDIYVTDPKLKDPLLVDVLPPFSTCGGELHRSTE